MNNDVEALIETLKGSHTGSVPSYSNLKALIGLDPKGPYHFVNLLKYKKQAQYPDGHSMAEKGLSGQDAYNLYGKAAFAQVTMRGGRLMQSNKVILPMGGGDWDSVATMEYQSINAFFKMLADPDYQASLIHRDAGLEATEIFVTRPLIQKPVGRQS